MHSPIIPPIDFIMAKLESFLECNKIEKLYMNPICGIKTCIAWPKTIGALRNMIIAKMVCSRWHQRGDAVADVDNIG